MAAGRIVYHQIDQKVVDGFINGTGQVSTDSGEKLRRIQSGKIQNYAAILFAAATVLAGLLIVIV